MTSSRLWRFTSALVVLTSAVWAQTGTSTIRGTVTDPSGAAIPGASVTATGPNNVVKVASSNQQGIYTITGLPAGAYTVRVLATGFNVFESPANLTSGAALTLNALLALVTEKQTVTVTDQLHVDVDPSNNASQLVLKGVDLDVLSDNPDDLQADLQALAGPSVGPNGGQIYIDGFTGGRLPPKESIREIRINQNPFSSEYDRLGYGRIEIFTKPGSDHFHGNAFFNFGDDVFNSRNPLAPRKVPYEQKYWGGNFSGPLNKKASFFIDFDRRALDDNAVVHAVLLDPSFNIVPFNQAVVTPNDRTTVSPRVDYQLSSNNTLVSRYTFTRTTMDNVGVGTFSLLSRGYTNQTTEQTAQATDTIVLNARAINETRVQIIHTSNQQHGDQSTAAITVPQSFVSGGSSVGYNYTDTNQYEVNNSTSFTFATHSLKFGARMRGSVIDDRDTTNYNGTFTFTSLPAYQQTELLMSQGVSPAQIRAMGYGASQFSIEGGAPLVHENYFDLGFYAQDDWRLKPNFTLSLGLRYETQNVINDRSDVAPRVGIAWGVGGGKSGPKTVIRVGSGIFYDRFTTDLILNSLHLNGVNQQQYVVTNPDFFPTVPSLASLSGNQSRLAIWRIDSHLHAPYVVQSAFGVDRQLPKNTSLSVTYAVSHGVHMLRARDINGPLVGTYDPAAPGSGVRPFGNIGDIYQYESSGIFNQQQLITNFNARMSARFSAFGYFVVGSAHSNTDGATTFPANQYDESSEYSRAAFDNRFHTFIGGNWTAPFAIRFSPYISESSGRPFNITIGKDVYGDTLFTARPAFAVPGRPSVMTPWGDFDPNPLPGEMIIPRNYGMGPSQFSVNLRISRTWGFGGESGGPRRPQGGDRGPGGGSTFGRGGPGGDRGGRGGGRGGRGGGGFGDSTNTGKRYNVTLSVSARNLFNHENFGLPVGNLSSPLFGISNTLSSSFGPGGSASGAGNRRIEMRLLFTF